MVNISYKPYTERFTYVTSGVAVGQIEYHGVAEPGSSESASVWIIKKYTYTGAYGPDNIKYASGSRVNNKCWDDRATYTYS